MDKKDSFDAFDVEKYATRGGMVTGPMYNSKVSNIDSLQKIQEKALKERNEEKTKSFLRQILDVLFNKKATTNQTIDNSSSIGEKQPEFSSIICHICGNKCAEMDFFCPKCGSKLRAGHYIGKK